MLVRSIRSMRPSMAAIIVAIGLAAPLAAAAQDGGFGTDIPLEFAVRQIVPEGHTVQIDEGVDVNARATWTDEGGWRQALASAARSAGYVATVADRTVRIQRPGALVQSVAAAPAAAPQSRPRPAPAASSSSSSSQDAPAARPRPAPQRGAAPPSRPRPRSAAGPAPAQSSETLVSGGGFVLMAQRARPVASAPERVASADASGWREYEQAPAAVAARGWIAQEGHTLHAILDDWATTEGWRLEWNSRYEYKLTSSARFDGDFVTATTELMRSMAQARPVLTAKFYQGNKVLVVGNGSLDETN